jgi:hypothetical protein
VNVIAMRLAYWQGRRRLVPAGAPVQTDEGGEYRLTNLSPGTYFVMAQLRDTWTVRSNGTTQAMGYAPTYFPGTANVADARRVSVGVVIRSIDAFRTFDIVWTLTGGGPARSTELFSLYAYVHAFLNLDFGKGSAAAIIGAVIILVVGLLLYRLTDRVMKG